MKIFLLLIYLLVGTSERCLNFFFVVNIYIFLFSVRFVVASCHFSDLSQFIYFFHLTANRFCFQQQAKARPVFFFLVRTTFIRGKRFYTNVLATIGKWKKFFLVCLRLKTKPKAKENKRYTQIWRLVTIRWEKNCRSVCSFIRSRCGNKRKCYNLGSLAATAVAIVCYFLCEVQEKNRQF